MAEMISVREAAVRWNITERRVATLCKNGRIAGAEKQGNRWLIPADTQKPADQRLKTGAFRKTERAPEAAPAHRRVQLLPCLVGILLHRQNDDDQGLHRRASDGDAVHPPPPLRQDAEYGYAAHLL